MLHNILLHGKSVCCETSKQHNVLFVLVLLYSYFLLTFCYLPHVAVSLTVFEHTFTHYVTITFN